MTFWSVAKSEKDTGTLDRSAACMVEGCNAGVVASCKNLGDLCMVPENANQEALRKRQACSLPGVDQARRR